MVDTWYGVNGVISAFASSKFPCRRLPDENAGSDTTKWKSNPAWWALNRLSDIRDPSNMVFLFDGIFYDLNYYADRINARHGPVISRTVGGVNYSGATQTNLLFFDSHTETRPTASLPGGMGPNPPGTNIFTSSLLTNFDTKWLTNQP